MQSPASIYKDVLIAPQTTPVIRAWNARTGAPLWTFHLIAQPGDPNHKTWENDAWKTIGGTNTWGYLTVDEERGIVYIPVSIAGSDYIGDRSAGRQPVRHVAGRGRHRDRQAEVASAARASRHLGLRPRRGADAGRRDADGKTIPAVAQINKMGLLFIFDRVTGEPIFGMEERPVPQSTVPGEKTSPTQPFPLKPPPLARNSLKRAELPKSISPELLGVLRGACGTNTSCRTRFRTRRGRSIRT